MIANKADIIAHESLGYSHVVWRGESYFVNLDSENSRLKFKEYLEEETGKEWDIAKLERYVFYRKDMYKLVNGNLTLNITFRGKVEIPINTVSCVFMFMGKNLEGIDFSDFNTFGIEDMGYMFNHCTFPAGFSLGDRFDTSSVKDMYSMFNSCTFPEDFSLGNKFDTSSVTDMGSMFNKANLPKGFSLGDKFDTSNVEFMHYMFNCAKFNEGFSLGDKFDTSNVKYIHYMFSDTKFNEDFRLSRDFTICSRAEGMFLNAKLPSRVAKQLSRKATAEEVVELLKSETEADF